MYRDCYAETSGRNILGEILPASLITNFPFSNSFFFFPQCSIKHLNLVGSGVLCVKFACLQTTKPQRIVFPAI